MLRPPKKCRHCAPEKHAFARPVLTLKEMVREASHNQSSRALRKILPGVADEKIHEIIALYEK